MQAIENLLPHRAPFLFVDEITESSIETIVGIKTFDERDNWLRGDFNFVPAAILMESMAQCGGAGARMLGTVNGVFGLAAIEKSEFYEGVTFGVQIKYVIQNIRITDKIIKQSGIAYMNEKPILKASWMSVKMSN